MPRKTLDKRKECVRLFLPKATKKPLRGVGSWLFSAFTTHSAEALVKEYRGINSRLLYGIFHFHFDGFIIDSSIYLFIAKRKALTIVRTRS